jgi:hypothetical protein
MRVRNESWNLAPDAVAFFTGHSKKLGLDTFISTFSKNFLFSSLQIVSSSEHNSETKQKQYSELESENNCGDDKLFYGILQVYDL